MSELCEMGGFLWQNGQMFDLNQITEGGGGQNWLQIASGINDKGHIVGLLMVPY